MHFGGEKQGRVKQKVRRLTGVEFRRSITSPVLLLRVYFRVVVIIIFLLVMRCCYRAFALSMYYSSAFFYRVPAKFELRWGCSGWDEC